MVLSRAREIVNLVSGLVSESVLLDTATDADTIELIHASFLAQRTMQAQ